MAIIGGGRITFRLGLALALASLACAMPCMGQPYGITARRITPEPWLHMPPHADGDMPKLLSQTGVFSDTRRLIPTAGLIPYELVVSFWSDGADKTRWVSMPAGKISFSPTGEWTFPPGTVFVKTFELPIDDSHPQLKRRLETRLLVRDADSGVYGVVYKWRADDSDADLISTSLVEPIRIRSTIGEREQNWYYPSREQCLECHNTHAGGVLGVKTRQLNRTIRYPSGVRDNQLRTWNHLKLFDPAISDSQIAGLPALAALDDSRRSLEDRARSYLDANCAQCHRPGGTVAYFDARYDTPLSQQQLVDGPVLIDQGVEHPRVVAPHDIWRSIAYMRANTNAEIRMPPLARETVDANGMSLLRQWILGLPGRDVVSPPRISPVGGAFDHPIQVTLTDDEPDADIRFTLDGSVPGSSDPHYDQPISVSASTVLRARAFMPGYTRSITTQEAFVIGP